jgi:hypothetical protein
MENEARNLTIGTLMRVAHALDRRVEGKLVRRKGTKAGRRGNGGERVKTAASAKPSGAQRTRFKAKAGNFKDPTRPDRVGVNATREWGSQT